MPKPLDLPHLTGKVPYEVERAIIILRDAIQAQSGDIESAHSRLDGLPTPLTLPDIQAALSPSGDYPLPTAGLLNTNEPPSVPGDTQPIDPINDGIPDFLPIVVAAHAAYGIGPTSPAEDVFNFARTVVENINLSGDVPPTLTCGLTDAPPTGDNIYTCQGETYRYARCTFSNDHTFKLLIDSDPGGARTPEWADEGITAGLYKPATPPDTPC